MSVTAARERENSLVERGFLSLRATGTVFGLTAAFGVARGRIGASESSDDSNWGELSCVRSIADGISTSMGERVGRRDLIDFVCATLEVVLVDVGGAGSGDSEGDVSTGVGPEFIKRNC